MMAHPVRNAALVRELETDFLRRQEFYENWSVPNRLRDYGVMPTNHFRSGVIPAGFAWAGAPFVAPAVVDYSQADSYLAVTPISASRHFLADAVGAATLNANFKARLGLLHHAAIGIRIDDGTDDNYSEGLFFDFGNGLAQFRTIERVGAGAPTTTNSFSTTRDRFFAMRLFTYSTAAPAFTPFYYWIMENGGQGIIDNTPLRTWTIARVGIVVQEGTVGSGESYCDWFYSDFA